MALLGPRDTSNLVLLTGWDAEQLKKLELADQTNYATIVAMLQAGLGALNAELNAHPVWGDLVSFTDRADVEYRVGSSNGFEVHTEYGRPDQKRAQTEGHMLPIVAYDRMLGWTWDYLQEARMADIEADVNDAIKDARNIYRKKLLTRVLQRGDDSGSANGLGSSGYSAGFATAAASTAVDFTPPEFNGRTFTSAHEHYVAIAGGAFTAAVFTDANKELREHGHEPPFDFIIGPDDEDTVAGLTGFTKAPEMMVRYGNDTAVSTLTNESQAGTYYIGTIKNFAVRVVPGIPQYYGFGWKSYGANSQRNPLRIRVPQGLSKVQFIAMPDPKAGTGINPLQNLMLYAKFGVGVADRTAGTARYVNNATWADGTAA